MEMTREDLRDAAGRETQGGLGAWLMEFFQTPLRVRFAGIGKARAKRRMELVEMLQLGGKRQLMLVVCDGQRYLVGAGGDSVQSIAEMRELPVSGYASLAMREEEDEAQVARQDLKEEAQCRS
jgi:flagellar biogenesis protein FliO